IIHNIKIDKGDPQNIDIWNELIEDVKKESIENIVIACTDLNVVLEKAHPSINIIDSSKCLAKAVVSEYLELDK
ncbi:MAG: amino-acid racemase, partial [Clostridiaceae bacterium]|nr:amino-acid racemase [Clostridiaceae bacterium]